MAGLKNKLIKALTRETRFDFISDKRRNFSYLLLGGGRFIGMYNKIPEINNVIMFASYGRSLIAHGYFLRQYYSLLDLRGDKKEVIIELDLSKSKWYHLNWLSFVDMKVLHPVTSMVLKNDGIDIDKYRKLSFAMDFLCRMLRLDVYNVFSLFGFKKKDLNIICQLMQEMILFAKSRSLNIRFVTSEKNVELITDKYKDMFNESVNVVSFIDLNKLFN